MPLLLDKTLTLLAMPLGTAVGAGLFALVALVLDRRRVAGLLLAFAIIWLWGWSTPFAANAVTSPLTSRYLFQRAEAMPAADAIVVLGNARPYRFDPAYPDLTDTADRIWYAARLYRAGKAPLVIISAGNVWGGQRRPSAAEATRVVLNAFGVPDDAIVIEKRSRNTRQNALFTKELAARRGIERVLLTTSASHMPRAEAAFRRAGLDVVPAATDYRPIPPAYRGPRRTPLILGLLPRVGALKSSSQALKEHLGLLVYRLRGWI